MATDLETIKEMFDRADVRYMVNLVCEEEFQDTHPTTTQVLETPNDYRLPVGVPNAVRASGNIGYHGFFTGFGFDKDGKLLWVGAWE